VWSCLGGSVGTEGIERGSRQDQSVVGEERKYFRGNVLARGRQKPKAGS